MIDKIQNTIMKYNLINKEDKILIGVSGGPDSMTLLHVLMKLEYNICVAHVNHGLRESADKEEMFVKRFCESNSVPFFSTKVNLKDRLNGMTVEEAGRGARYDFFNEVLKKEKCTKIATAHNSNDNAETVIMNMIRGTGLNGLKGIEPKRDNIIRPLIEVTRQEIEEYCQENCLSTVHDESNDEPVYTRNKVRLELIPYIEKNINTNVINNINRMSTIILEEENYIEGLVDKAYNECIVEENNDNIVMRLKLFNALDKVLRRRLILKFIIKINGTAKDIEKVHVDDILKLCENNVGGKYLKPNKHIMVSVLRGKAKFEKVQ